MDIKAAILAAEALLAEAGLTYTDFCQRADVDIHPSTWRDWRSGGLPTLRLWYRVVNALDLIRAEQQGARVRSEAEEGQP